MLVIADNLTVTNPRVAELVAHRDAQALAQLVGRLERAGSDVIDLNLGFRSKDGPAAVRWLVRTAAEHTDLRLCLDTADPETMHAGLAEAGSLGLDPPPILNSFSLDPKKSGEILPLAAEYGTDIVGFCVRDVVPTTPEERLETAVSLVERADEAGVPRDRVYLDPILFPLASFQDDMANVLEFLRALPELFDPPVKSMAGLSNAAYGVPRNLRPKLEAALLPLLSGLGLDAIMLNVLSPELRGVIHVLQAIEGTEIFSPAIFSPAGLETEEPEKPDAPQSRID